VLWVDHLGCVSWKREEGACFEVWEHSDKRVSIRGKHIGREKVCGEGLFPPLCVHCFCTGEVVLGSGV
jgi:hypothetical protein